MEVRDLIVVAQFLEKKVLEIGCGNTDFTQQYAGNDRDTFGVDPRFTDLQAAKNSQIGSSPNVFITKARGEALPFRSSAFEITILASSL